MCMQLYMYASVCALQACVYMCFHVCIYTSTFLCVCFNLFLAHRRLSSMITRISLVCRGLLNLQSTLHCVKVKAPLGHQGATRMSNPPSRVSAGVGGHTAAQPGLGPGAWTSRLASLSRGVPLGPAAPTDGSGEVWSPEHLTMFGKKALAWRLSSILNRAGRSMMSCSVSPSSFLRMSRFQSRQRWVMGKKGRRAVRGARHPCPLTPARGIRPGAPALQAACRAPPVRGHLSGAPPTRTSSRERGRKLQNSHQKLTERTLSALLLITNYESDPKCVPCSVPLNPQATPGAKNNSDSGFD